MGVQNLFILGDGCSGCWQSSWHHKTLPVDLLAQPLTILKRRLIPERGIANTCELVGKRTGRLVVIAAGLHIQSPAPHTTDLTPGVVRNLGGSEHAPGAVGQQHAQVAVPLLGDVPQVATIARAVFLGRQAKPAGEMPCSLGLSRGY